VVLATLYALQRNGELGGEVVAKAIVDLGIDPSKPAPS
jgi:pyruvate dehydrogenase E1 component